VGGDNAAAAAHSTLHCLLLLCTCCGLCNAHRNRCDAVHNLYLLQYACPAGACQSGHVIKSSPPYHLHAARLFSHHLPCPHHRPDCPKTLVEFGAGNGSPIISALLKVPPVPGRAIHSYEISPASAHLASASAAKVGLGDTYVVHNSCFWEGLKQTPCDCIISNPPYLPAPGEMRLPNGGVQHSNGCSGVHISGQ
jgi:hypothetical protein